MNDATSMRSRERVSDLNSNQKRGPQLQRMSIHQLPHVATLDVLHGDEVVALGFIEIEDGGDVWMIERRGQPRLAFKAPEVSFPGSQLRRQDFDYHCAAKFSVGSFVDSALPAHAELLENFVVL